MAMSMLWGSTVDSKRADNVATEFQAVTFKILEVLSKPNVSDFFPILARFDLQRLVSQTKRLMQWFDQILDPILESLMKMNSEEDGLLSKEKKDFIQILMELKEQEDAAMPITLPQIKSMLLVIWLPQLTFFFSFLP